MTAPLVVAHRTCPLDAPENSLAGIALARVAGADAVEFDVRLSRDGVPVLVHDSLPWRTLRWPLPVAWTPCRWLDRMARRGGRAGCVTLAAALEACEPPIRPAIHLKAPAALRATLDAVAAADRRDAMLWSDDAAVLAHVHRHAPGVQTALLRNTSTWQRTWRYIADAANAHAHAVSLHQRAVSARSVAEAHRNGLVAFAWVLDLGAQPDVVACGVDGVVTDWPRQARELLDR